MEKVLYLVLKNSKKTFDVLEELKDQGFNGTVIGSNSLRHTMNAFPEEHHFLSLRHLEDVDVSESVLCMFVWKEEVIEVIKNEIRRLTHDFKDIRGFMFSLPLNDFEGCC